VRFGSLLNRLIGQKARTRTVVFDEAGRSIECVVPEDDLWGAVKDNLLFQEYERAGIAIPQCTGVVVDAGAHVGVFTLRAATYARKVIAIEAHPENRSLLIQNIQKNDLQATVQVLPNALWRTRETLHLAEGTHSGGASLLVEGGEHLVEGVTLDDVLADVERADLLKLDIEGAEFEVLKTCSAETLSKFGAVVGELHPKLAGENAKVAFDAMRAAGFRHVCILTAPSERPREYVLRLLGNWKKLHGNTRLKVVILMVYLGFGTLRLLPVVRRRLDQDDLRFLYATK